MISFVYTTAAADAQSLGAISCVVPSELRSEGANTVFDVNDENGDDSEI